VYYHSHEQERQNMAKMASRYKILKGKFVGYLWLSEDDLPRLISLGYALERVS
jgi:hypothetical protein